MKKFILIMIAIMAMGVQTISAQTPKVILQHEGGITLYESNALQTAINAAAVGDTIYLSKGTFMGPIDINKRLSVIGAGQTSIISGSITISFTETGISTTYQRILDALKCSGTVKVTSVINNFNIRKCNLDELSFDQTSTNINDGLIDRCSISAFYTGKVSRVKSLTLQNSKIGTLSGSCEKMTFQNCNISYIPNGNNSTSYFYGNLTNSIVYRNGGSINFSSYYTLKSDVVAINTLFYSTWNISNAQCQNCYKDESNNLISSNYDCIFNKETLMSKGYVGLDGTCVGVEGGTTPYTLVPNTPSVYDSNISVDKDSNKLNVSLKVKVE